MFFRSLQVNYSGCYLLFPTSRGYSQPLGKFSCGKPSALRGGGNRPSSRIELIEAREALVTYLHRPYSVTCIAAIRVPFITALKIEASDSRYPKHHVIWTSSLSSVFFARQQRRESDPTQPTRAYDVNNLLGLPTTHFATSLVISYPRSFRYGRRQRQCVLGALRFCPSSKQRSLRGVHQTGTLNL
jgi:hypothetical protein